MPKVFIGVGSNIDPEKNIIMALKLLDPGGPVKAVSTFYCTEPVGKRPGRPLFYNGVVEITTGRPPCDLKEQRLRRIEGQLGRQRTSDKDAPRTIDLDILCYDDRQITAGGLQIPDPAIADRPFLAVPLAELAPEYFVPGTGKKPGRWPLPLRPCP